MRHSERRQGIAQTQRSKLFAPTREVRIVSKESGSPLLDGRCEGRVDLKLRGGIDNHNFQTEAPSRRLRVLGGAWVSRSLGRT